MRRLLDTHIWLWSLREPRRLGRRVRHELANPNNELWLSPVSNADVASGNHEEGMYFILAEMANVLLARPQHRHDILGGAIAKPNPNHLRRESEEKTALMKFRVLGNDREALLARDAPDNSSSALCSPNSLTCEEPG